MQSTASWLSFLKLRASWGSLGNERIGNYPYQALLRFENNSLFYKGNTVQSAQFCRTMAIRHPRHHLGNYPFLRRGYRRELPG